LAIAANAELFCGRFEKAREYYQRIEGRPAARWTVGMQAVELGYIYWKAGRREEAKEMFQTRLERLQKQVEQGDEGFGIRFSIATIFAIQGKTEEALGWLEKAFDAGWWQYRYAARYPLLENIRDHERFKRIMNDVKTKVSEMRRRVELMEWDTSM
jgi:tetratricopeptide (TPR) repeat protein